MSQCVSTSSVNHLWKETRNTSGKHSLSTYLKEDLYECIKKLIRNNAYFAHLENLLVAMLCDDDVKGKPTLGKFKVPSFNFNWKDYTELIDWKKCNISEPPLIRTMQTENLTESTRKNVIYLISKYIFHMILFTFPERLRYWKGMWKKSPHPLTWEMASSDTDSQIGKTWPFLKRKWLYLQN